MVTMLNVSLLFFSAIVILLISMSSSQEQLSCPKMSQCIPLTKCKKIETDIFLYPCHAGLNMVCCPQDRISENANSSIQIRNTSLFPVNCGLIMTSDKVSGGKTAELGQFPWMALLGYKQKTVNDLIFSCGGSLITECYVLTAAHCLDLSPSLELTAVRLGEHDLSKNQDCVSLLGGKTCAEPPVDYLIDHTLKHPKYSSSKLSNDVALVKVKQRVKFTDFIRPVCLPFERELESRNLAKQKFTVSGWGKTSYRSVAQSNTLQFAAVTVWDHAACAKHVPAAVKPITDSQLCANGPAKEDACRGDSGGPLVNATVDVDRELRYFQVGVVSFASTLTCGDPSLPTVYTRIDKYLDWIEDNVL